MRKEMINFMEEVLNSEKVIQEKEEKYNVLVNKIRNIYKSMKMLA